MSTRPYEVLLLDFGGVCLLNPVELHCRAERVLGLDEGTLDWLGPVAPETDPLWRQMISGNGVTERDYWVIRAKELSDLSGRKVTLRDYMTLLFDPPTPEVVRAEAVDTVELAKEAGYGVSVLTNDMRAFHGREWEHRVDFLKLVDHIVDCSDTGIFKPDRRAFERAVKIIGVPSSQMLFVDDQPINVEAAREAGMQALWFDISQAEESWNEVATLLNL